MNLDQKNKKSVLSLVRALFTFTVFLSIFCFNNLTQADLSQTPETITPLIPVMTSNLQDGFKLTSSFPDPYNNLKQSFDGRADTYFNLTPPGFIQVELPEVATIRYYSITNNTYDSRSPRTWALLGSNDGSLWLPLDDQNDPVESSFFVIRGEKRIFQIPEQNIGSYKFYRLKLVRGYDDGRAGILVGDFQLYSTPAAQPMKTLTPIIPVMTGTIQDGIKLTSSFADPYNNLRQAFDNRADTYFNLTAPGIIQVEFPSPIAVRYYSITNNSYDYRSLRTWILLGSNDGSLWFPLDQRDNPVASSF
ncbi:MAG TPA: hypothetical protein VHY08_23320, partial [Bacillota bacterium]|nr:hypothetical protein [Bacillota bacterium]